MIKRFFTFILFMFFLIPSAYSLQPISTCQNLDIAGETYVLTQDIIDRTTNCFTVSVNNVVLDLGGHTVDGAGINNVRAFYNFNTIDNFNFTIKNGHISDFDTGIYFVSNAIITQNVTIQNISFSSNVDEDIYSGGNSKNYPKRINIIDVTLDKGIDADAMNEVYIDSSIGDKILSADLLEFENIETLNLGTYETLITNSSFRLSSIDNFIDESLEQINVTSFFISNSDLNLTNSLIINVDNLCDSTLSNVVNDKELNIVMQNNSSDVLDCFTSAATNIVLDMNGYAINGYDGTGSDGIQINQATTDWNLTIKNGIIKDFAIGAYIYTTTNSKQRTILDNVTFVSNLNHDIYIWGNGAHYDKEIEIIDCKFDTKGFYAGHIKTININTTNSNSLNLGHIETAGAITNLNFGNYNEVNVTKFILAGITNIDFSNSFKLNVDDLCGSSLTLSNNKELEISMQNNSYDVSTCFISNGRNIVIDMNGHTITGDDGGSDNGIYPNQGSVNWNLTVKNGIIKDFGRGAYIYTTSNSKQRTVLKNITFLSNLNHDIYIWGNGAHYDKEIEIIDCKFDTKGFYAGHIKTIQLGTTYSASLNLGHIETAGAVTNLNFGNYDEINVTKFILAGITNLNYSNSFKLNVDDLCSSSLSNLVNEKELNIVMQNDSHDVLDCFTSTATNVVLDMNGHTIEGDAAANSDGIQANFNTINWNLTVKNGIIKDFYRGAYIYTTTNSKQRTVFDNVDFVSNTHFDIYVGGNGNSYDKRIDIMNCQFDSAPLSFNLFKDVYMYGNNISNSSIVILSSVANFNDEVLVNNSLVGNFWRDFTCGNPTDSYEVINSEYTYTICNSTDYNSGIITDSAPLLNMVYVAPVATPPVAPENESFSGTSTMFDFYDNVSLFLGIGLILSFLFA